MLSSTARTCVATSKAACSIICLRMTAPFQRELRQSPKRSDPGSVCDLALEKPCEALQAGEIHTRRKCCTDRNRCDPEQPLADAHLIPRVAPSGKRRLQGRPR